MNVELIPQLPPQRKDKMIDSEVNGAELQNLELATARIPVPRGGCFLVMKWFHGAVRFGGESIKTIRYVVCRGEGYDPETEAGR
jgi:hypothetical protein